MKESEVRALAKGFGKALDERLAPLEARVAELERLLGYPAQWEAQRVYTVGDVVRKGSSHWCCVDTCMGCVPGASAAWQRATSHD